MRLFGVYIRLGEERGERTVGERGYTLVEILMVVAIIAVVTAAIMPSFRENPAEISTSIAMVSAMIDEASALAFANGADAEVGRGATIQFTTDKMTGETVGRVYWGRPYNVNGGIFLILRPENDIPEIRTKVCIRILESQKIIASPFAIFISPSGHASFASGEYIQTVRHFSENACMKNFIMNFSSGEKDRNKQVSCNYIEML